MILLLSNGNGLAILVYSIFGLWFLPPIILTIIGIAKFKKKRETAKKLFIAAVVYLLIGGGICGAIILGNS